VRTDQRMRGIRVDPGREPLETLLDSHLRVSPKTDACDTRFLDRILPVVASVISSKLEFVVLRVSLKPTETGLATGSKFRHRLDLGVRFATCEGVHRAD